MNKLNNIHEKCLRLITNKYDSPFNELQKTCSNYLTIHSYSSEKFLQYSKFLFIWHWTSTVSAFWSGCNSVCTHLWKKASPLTHDVISTPIRRRTMSYDVETTSFVYRIEIKDSSSLEIFQAKIKLWNCDDYLCNPCKRFITKVGYIVFFFLLVFLVDVY